MSGTSPRNPEEMVSFFDARASSYDQHMRDNVELFHEFYSSVVVPFRPTSDPIEVLDLGCGTGLELEGIFAAMPNAKVTCVDLSPKMLDELVRKYQDKKDQIRPVTASYLTMDLGQDHYDYVVSVMSVHHLLHDTKRKLYERIRQALKQGGKYVEGDYVVSLEEESSLLDRFREQFGPDKAPVDGYYHIDIPFSIDTQTRLFKEAGFAHVDVVWHKAQAAVMVAGK